MSFRERFFGSGLISNIGANGLGLSVQLLIQLGSVPILAHSWGLERYGVWLVMLAVPGYLAVADLGYQGAAANDMTASVAKGERGMARSVFQSVVLATLGVMAVLALGIVFERIGVAEIDVLRRSCLRCVSHERVSGLLPRRWQGRAIRVDFLDFCGPAS